MALIDFVENKILQLLAPILGPIKPLITIFTKFKDSTFGIIDAATNLFNSASDLIDKIKNFQEKPQVKNRVISVPRVVDNIEELIALPGKIVDAFKDLFAQLKNKLDPAAFDVEELEGLEDLRAIIGRFGSKIAAGFEKVLGIVTLVVDALVTIRATIDDIQEIIDEVTVVVDDLTNLDVVFLPQSNPRETLHLQDGGTIRVRVGNLH